MRAEFVVYLSSTLDDLREERDLALKIIGEMGVVRTTYRADKSAPVDACLADVRTCHLYVGILGLRYGWIPPVEQGGTGSRSITELEYDACASGGTKIPRLMFLKTTLAGIDQKHIDALSNPATAPAIAAFRDRASQEQTPYQYDNLEAFRAELRIRVGEYADRFHRERTVPGPGPWLKPGDDSREHLGLVSVGCVPGTDAAQHDALHEYGAGLVTPFELSPDDPEYLWKLDKGLARSQLAALLVTPASLNRLTQDDRPSMVAAALAMLRVRTGHAVLLCEGVDPGNLPAAWRDAETIVLPDKALSGADAARSVTGLYPRFREIDGQLTRESRIALPYLVVAPTLAEVQAMTGTAADTTFRNFGAAGSHRRQQFDRIAGASRSTATDWPDRVYGARRADWKCFGPETPTAEEIVRRSVARINAAPSGSREMRLLRRAQLLPRCYEIDEYFADRWGSRRIVEGLRDTTLLILVDEVALLHPGLRGAAETLLSSTNHAVVSISPCDPAHTRTDELLGDLSYLRVGNIVSRFRTDLDPRCEIAVNSIDRIDRWLRATLPELVAAAGDQLGDPGLLARMERELAQ